MKTLEILRKKAYWTLDSMKGSPVGRQLADIEAIMSAGFNVELGVLNSSKSSVYINDILNYAISHVPYYKSFKEWQRLTDFPIVNKNIIRNNEAQFLSDEFEKSQLVVKETSGSTGMPFTVYQDVTKRHRATADTLWFSKRAHYELGSRLYFSRVWDQKTTRSKLECLRQNWVMHDASSLSDEVISRFINQLEQDNSTKSVIIFASTLTAIAKYVERSGVKPKAKIASFITISESLPIWTKATIERQFDTLVFSRYSNQELGIMAQQMEGSDDFLVNTASFHFELLAMDNDAPVADGEEGRIVVTDLFNHAMPLIRYDTGDIAIRKPGCERLIFEKVGGRRVDYIFDTKGKLVSPYVINTPMHEFLEIQQYQFIQEGEKDYTMLLNMKDGNFFKREGEMLMMLKFYLGEDSKICVKYVDEIPVLKSGKRKQVVNNYKPA